MKNQARSRVVRGRFKIHDGPGHAFENRSNQDGYRPADAWKRAVDFLGATLQ